jgi:UDP-N-acetylglucosamine--N-acetylmuramyl-(pentapeptide) pyrophosphoryl-undecaprenol N-acetylglucosamine transferase
MSNKVIFLAAGGTAGHINAALALGGFYEEQGYLVRYFTGKRPLDLKLFKGHDVEFLNVAAIRSKSPITLIKSLFTNAITFIGLFKIITIHKPELVGGMGGYVCGPMLLAARLMGKKTFILEQNAIAGLTNQLLSRVVNYKFVNFNETKKMARDQIVVGNPIRNEFDYHKFQREFNPDEPVKLFFFGGSLGATQINQLVEKLCITLDNISIKHQVGLNNSYQFKIKDGIEYQQLEYVDDMFAVYNWADVIICRSGASTVSELAVVAKPCILIPFPYAVDNHQYYNALKFKESSDFPCEIIQDLTDESIARIQEFVSSLKNYKFKFNPSNDKNDACKKIYNILSHHDRN